MHGLATGEPGRPMRLSAPERPGGMARTGRSVAMAVVSAVANFPTGLDKRGRLQYNWHKSDRLIDRRKKSITRPGEWEITARIGTHSGSDMVRP
jgi:hypothetical protein